MNIEKIFDKAPPRDYCLDIFIMKHKIEDVLPEFELCSESCICICNVSEDAVNNLVQELNGQCQIYMEKIQQTVSCDVVCEQRCKPICLFESKETAIRFVDFANLLNSEDFMQFIFEISSDYNEPWQYVKKIKDEEVYSITEHYERVFLYD